MRRRAARRSCARSASRRRRTPGLACSAARRAGWKRSRSTPQLTTSVLPRASGTDCSSRARSQSETAITRRRAANDAADERPDERILGRVGDVLAVRGDDERRPDGPRGDERTEAGRKEEVRVDDVRPEAAGAPGRARSASRRWRSLPPPRRSRTTRSIVVAAGGELALQALHEDAEVGRRRPTGTSARRAGSASGESLGWWAWPSLGRATRRTCPTPRGARSQISPIVTRARSASRIGGSRFSVPARDAAYFGERGLRLLGVPLGPDARRPLELAALGVRIDPQQLDVLRRPRR